MTSRVYLGDALASSAVNASAGLKYLRYGNQVVSVTDNFVSPFMHVMGWAGAWCAAAELATDCVLRGLVMK